MTFDRTRCVYWAMAPGRRVRHGFVATAVGVVTALGSGAAELWVERVDPETTGYATFQSHNQKMVQNPHGIFLSHIRSRNEAYTAQTWRLSRSIDGGRTFESIYEDTHATNPPVLETDTTGNVYLVRVDFLDNNAYLYRFLAENAFRDPKVSSIPAAAAGKYAMALDEPRGQLYFFAHNNTFHVVGLDGTVRSSVTLLQGGANAVLQYPLLSLADDGALHAAWTTQRHGVYLYWDIHHMMSKDGGATWQNLDGTPLSVPVIADDTGPALRISLDDEFEVHTWLSSFMVKGGKIHFAYLAQTELPRQHYVRYDIATGTREIDAYPDWRGGESDYASIQSLDGYFATPDQGPDSPLYFAGAYQGRIVIIESRDNGTAWLPHAHSMPDYTPYSVTGPRRTLESGGVIGAFTDTRSTAETETSSAVYVFRTIEH